MDLGIFAPAPRNNSLVLSNLVAFPKVQFKKLLDQGILMLKYLDLLAPKSKLARDLKL